jgi:hypothetical protein
MNLISAREGGKKLKSQNHYKPTFGTPPDGDFMGYFTVNVGKAQLISPSWTTQGQLIPSGHYFCCVSTLHSKDYTSSMVDHLLYSVGDRHLADRLIGKTFKRNM